MNNPPITPTIAGPSNGKIGETYTYTFSTTDPDDDEITYYVNWGDDTNSGWIGPYSSGEQLNLSHCWDEKGTYSIRVKAKDVFDAESDWTTLEVSMPKNKPINTLFLNILENHPHMFPILRYWMRL